MHMNYTKPWPTWRHVDEVSRQRMFKRFGKIYQWPVEEEENIYKGFVECFKERFRGQMRLARENAMKRARLDGHEFEGKDFSVMREYNPTWIRIGLWQKLCDGWNTDAWRRISESGSINRNSIVDGSVSKHTCGSITIEQTRKKMKKKLGHEPSWTAVYSRTHTKRSKSGEESGEIQPVFITDRSRNFHESYTKAMNEKYGDDSTQHPGGDVELWEQCTGGKRKGRVFGVGSSDPCFAVTGSTPYGCGSSSHDYAQSQQEIRHLREVLEDNRQELEQYRKEREEHQLELEQSRKEREESEARIQETIADLYRKLGQNIAPPPDGGL